MLNVKKIFIFGLLVCIIAALPFIVVQDSFAFVSDSPALQQYLLRPHTELSKIIYLIDRFKELDPQLSYEGATYTAQQAHGYVMDYVATHYRGEDAKAWISEHAYRSLSKREIIYIRLENGKWKQLNKVLLDELKALDEFLAKDK